ncbi:uncharacterized protein LOC141617834 [Silene latifolia]|uniref:uncharacterized protein LOC141617834 n=1 Tax=Silene latifolia TaxID=37657 RepID=UPI003D77D2D7
MHIDSFNAQNSIAPITSVPNPTILIPNSSETIGITASSYKSMIQGFDDGANPLNDLSLDDIDLDSEDDAEEEGDEEDVMCPRICLTKKEKAIIYKPWRHSLIIKMFDKYIGYLSLMRKLQAKSSIKGKLTLTDLTNSYYIVRFSSKQDYDFVMTQGLWMIDDHYLTIRKWVPNFVPTEDNITKLTAWVRIPNLPVEYFNSTFLKKIGSKIGEVIRIDNNTTTAQIDQFTRLSVEVDISKPLLSKFRLNGKVYGIQYEGLKMICFKCGKTGHTTEQCKKDESSKVIMEVDDQSDNHFDANAGIKANSLEAGLRPEESADFREWLVVKKPPRRKPITSVKQALGPGNENTIFNFGQSSKSSGSRFGILEVNPEDSIIPQNPSQAPINAPNSGIIPPQNHGSNKIINQRIVSLNKQTNKLLSNSFSNRNINRYNKKDIQNQSISILTKKSTSQNIPKDSSNILKDITNIPAITKLPITTLTSNNAPASSSILKNSSLESESVHTNEPTPTLLLSRPPPPSTLMPPSEPPDRGHPATQKVAISTWPEMAAPYLGIMISEYPIMDVRIELAENNPSNLTMELSIPWSIDSVLKLVSRAYLLSLNYLPDLMSTRIPNLTPNLPHIMFMVWNVQGTRHKNKINVIKEVVRVYKPSVLSLVETHMGGDHAIKLGNILGYNGYSRVNAVGFSGSIWLYWKTGVVTVNPVREHPQYITIEIARNGEFPWFFSANYASPDPNNRQELWNELEAFARNNNRPWLIAGDINETSSLSERHGGDANMARRCQNFNNWIENCEFIELAFTGASHTWARGNTEETRKSARLDRALCNAEWGTLFEDVMVNHLPAVQSDHCPLLISPNGFAPLNAVNRPFRFQACWLTHERFKDFIESNWPTYGVFPTRLESLSRRLQDWNSEVFGDIFKRKRSLMARIGGCQRELSMGRQSHLIKLEAKLRKN